MSDMNRPNGKVVCFKTKAKAEKFMKQEKAKGKDSSFAEPGTFFGMKFFCIGTY